MKNSEITNNMTFVINYLHENLISMDIWKLILKMKRKENLNVITAWTLITIVKNSLEKNVKKNMKEMSKTIYIIEKVINISCFLVSAFFLKNS